MTRRRFKWNLETQSLEPIDLDAPVTPRLELATGTFYEAAGRATDGTDISSKRKYAEYCRVHNVTPSSDFTRTWAKAAAERVNPKPDPARRETIGRALYAAQRGRK